MEQMVLTEKIPGATYAEIHSDFGHDGFLVENDQLMSIIGNFLESRQ